MPATVGLSVELEGETGDDGTGHELELEVEFDAVEGGGGTGAEAAAPDDATGGGEGAAGADERTTGADEGPTGDEADADDGEEYGDATAAVGGATPAPKARFEVYRDRGGKWRWRLVHHNGNTIATAGQGYTRRHSAEKGLRSVVRNATGAPVERLADDGPEDDG